MGKPIKLTQAVIEGMAKEFMEALTKMKLSDGKVTYSKSFAYQDHDDAVLCFSTMAFAKMTRLIQSFDCEIAWHASCHRDEEEPNWFYVDDILVYPQTVTGVTVTMDEEEYGKWLQKGFMDGDERFDHIHFQGHSHVNMDVGPSSTDKQHQEEILSQLRDTGYYIFMIANKKFQYNVWIFDLKNNVLYENKEVSILIGDESVDLDAFEEEAKKLAPKKTVYAVGNNAGNTGNTGTTKPAENQYGGYQWGRGYRDYRKDSKDSYRDYDDYLEGYYGYYGGR